MRAREPRHASTYRGARRNAQAQAMNMRGTDKKAARKLRKAAKGKQ